ncbi:MAG: response regulator [Deltaproteobacteria bacterium]|nr:response regulator [Kofleriaceae bacterium]
MADDGELRRITRERDQAIERFVLMCRAMNGCMWDWDIRANVAFYSEAVYTVYGIGRDVTPSFERWTTYVHPDDRERVVSGFREALETGKSEWAGEYRFVRPDDGRVLEVFDRGFVMFDGGAPVRMVGVVMDITPQRALERQLRHSQKMQAVGQLAGGIAHDFNNMLQAAKLEIELLRGTPSASVQVLEHVKALGTAIDRAAGLTRQLLTFSRPEAMRTEALDLNAKVGELATMLRRLLGEDVHLALELAGEVIYVDADASMLDQVLVNLVVNGRDAMAGGGTLSLATARCGQLEPAGRRPGRYVRVDVRDTDVGIPGEILPRIFEPFFTTKPNGTGLGLATVYGIVEQHGGWIDVDTTPGSGTTFHVYLPEHVRGPADRVRPPAITAAPGTETILLVDDDDGVRRALSLVLESHGYTVLAVDSGAAALAAWESSGGKIDVLVTDLKMPGMSGSELAAALSARRPALPIVLISGHLRELDPSLAARYQLLHKPFDGERLVAVVRESLQAAAKA